MKIKAVERICRSEHLVILVGSNAGEQWIGASGALYPLHGFPKMDEVSVFAWMDIPEAKRKNYVFQYDYELYEAYDFSDSSDGERYIERGRYTITTPRGCMEPLNVSEGVIYINAEYLKPFGDRMMLYERRTNDGRLYIAVKEGLLLKGIIMPMVIEQSMADDLLEIARLTRMAKRYIVSAEVED